jgi:hypothetical protein
LNVFEMSGSYHHPQDFHRASRAPPPPMPRFLVRGAVVFVRLPQTLSPDDPSLATHKTRPVVVLNKSVSYKVNGNGGLHAPFSFIGVPGTSKDYVVDGRPSMPFTIPPQDITTYAHADGVRTVTAEEALKPVYHLKPPELARMQRELDAVLRPEQSFYRRRFFSDGHVEGKMWVIKTHGDDRERQALILLRRGKFFMGDVGGDAYQPEAGRKTHFTPYLMAVFRTAEKIASLRGINWSDVDILAVHERSFVRPAGEMQKDTVETVLNNLRHLVGLEPIEHRQPPVRSLATILHYIARSAMYLPH